MRERERERGRAGGGDVGEGEGEAEGGGEGERSRGEGEGEETGVTARERPALYEQFAVGGWEARLAQRAGAASPSRSKKKTPRTAPSAKGKRSVQKREGCGRGSDTDGICGGRSEGSWTPTSPSTGYPQSNPP